jgi:hypothetical protein
LGHEGDDVPMARESVNEVGGELPNLTA